MKGRERVLSNAVVVWLMTSVHQALRGTRGAVGTICLVDGDRLEACAVGNVSLLCASCYVPLVLSPGILGQSVSKFRVASAQLASGARLALLSDGLSLRFKLDELRELGSARGLQIDRRPFPTL